MAPKSRFISSPFDKKSGTVIRPASLFVCDQTLSTSANAWMAVEA